MGKSDLAQDLEQQKDALERAGNGDGGGNTTIRGLVKQMEPEIAKALPRSITPERFTRIVLTELSRTPQLGDCDPNTFLGAVMYAAQLGLEPGGPLDHAHLVPFWNSGRKVREVQLILGYKGLADLARRSGQVTSLDAREVCEGDTFEYEFGSDKHLRHRPATGERGQAVAYYAHVRYVNGGEDFEVMTRAEVEAHRDRFVRNHDKSTSPWKTDFDAMARKTVLRKLAKLLPLTPEAAAAVAGDEAVIRGFGEATGTDVIDLTPSHELTEKDEGSADDAGEASPVDGPAGSESADAGDDGEGDADGQDGPQGEPSPEPDERDPQGEDDDPGEAEGNAESSPAGVPTGEQLRSRAQELEIHGNRLLSAAADLARARDLEVPGNTAALDEAPEDLRVALGEWLDEQDPERPM